MKNSGTSGRLLCVIKTLVALLFFSLVAIPVQPAFSQYSCLPTCDGSDSKNFVFASQNLNALVQNGQKFSITSPANSSSFEIGIFDGDDGNGTATTWDRNSAVLRITLFADPLGDGSGTTQLAQWSGDGSFGDNLGDPMPDNEWYVIILNNFQQALSNDGDYKYFVVIETAEAIPPNPNPSVVNAFKIRTDGFLSLFPGELFNYLSNNATEQGLLVVYPNFDPTDPQCADTTIFDAVCNITDPDCCLNPTTYDGNWRFACNIPPGSEEVSMWDGDFDVGSAPTRVNPGSNDCLPNGFIDTDDSNTPNTVPSFAQTPNTVAEDENSAYGPPDDTCINLSVRPTGEPNGIVYTFTSPSGEVFTNNNASGDEEWEFFNLSTAPFDPSVMDIHVDSIEPGTWLIDIRGVDRGNLNAIRTQCAFIGLDEEGNPVLPIPSAQVPTLNQWGLIVASLFMLFASLYYSRFRRTSKIKT